MKISTSRLLLVFAIVLIAACAAFGLMKLHESNVASRELKIERLQQAQIAEKAASKQLTGDVAEYSSAYSAEAADATRRPASSREDASNIGSARAANDRIAVDLGTIARVYATIYGDGATKGLRAAAGSAHDACARSLAAWARADYVVSKRKDQECAQYGMKLGNELDALGSRLEADLTATRTSLSAL